jgi:hypothetical protein
MMSQHAERARAIRLAGKLINNNGRSEGEVEQAMEKLQSIMTTFNLTINDIVLANAEYQTLSVEMMSAKGCPMQSIVVAIADFTDTKVWRESGKKKYVHVSSSWNRRGTARAVAKEPGHYKFFGIVQDVQYAEFLYNLIKDSLPAAEAKFKRSRAYTSLKGIRGAKKSALVSFRSGYISRLSYRLNDMRHEMDKDIAAQDVKNGGTDIVHSKSVAREAKFNEMLGIKLVRSGNYRTGGRSSTGYHAGRESANNVNLSRPMGNSSRTLLLS